MDSRNSLSFRTVFTALVRLHLDVPMKSKAWCSGTSWTHRVFPFEALRTLLIALHVTQWHYVAQCSIRNVTGCFGCRALWWFQKCSSSCCGLLSSLERKDDKTWSGWRCWFGVGWSKPRMVLASQKIPKRQFCVVDFKKPPASSRTQSFAENHEKSRNVGTHRDTSGHMKT